MQTECKDLWGSQLLNEAIFFLWTVKKKEFQREAHLGLHVKDQHSIRTGIYSDKLKPIFFPTFLNDHMQFPSCYKNVWTFKKKNVQAP